RLPLRRRGIQRGVSRALPRRGAAGARGAARRDRALPDGGPRRGPAEEGRRGQQAARRRDEREDAVGHGVDRCRAAFRTRAHAAPRDQGGRRGALPREESRPQPGEPMTAAVIATLALFLVAAAWIYNRLVADRNQARQGFADIDVRSEEHTSELQSLRHLVC